MPYCDVGTTGLTGTIAVTILDAAGAVHVARTTAGISEPVAGSGTYYVAEHDGTVTLTYVWDRGAGTQTASETLYAGRQGDAYAEAVLVHAHVADCATATAVATIDGIVDAILVDTSTTLDVAVSDINTDVSSALAALEGKLAALRALIARGG